MNEHELFDAIRNAFSVHDSASDENRSSILPDDTIVTIRECFAALALQGLLANMGGPERWGTYRSELPRESALDADTFVMETRRQQAREQLTLTRLNSKSISRVAVMLADDLIEALNEIPSPKIPDSCE